MMITSSFRIGGVDYAVEVDDEDPKQAFQTAIFTAPRETCDVCGVVGFDTKQLVSYRTREKGFIYVKLICDCGAASTLGEYLNGGVFWKPYEEVQRDDDGRAVEPEPALSQRRPTGQHAEGWGFNDDPTSDQSITDEQVREIQRLRKQQNLTDRDLAGLVNDLVDREVTSLRGLTTTEADAAIARLRQL